MVIAAGAMECFGQVQVPRRGIIRRMFTRLTCTKFHADGETPQFAGQFNEPGHEAQACVSVRLEVLMLGQRHCADGHAQFPFGKEGLNLLNFAGRKLHHFCTVSAPLVRLRVVQLFRRAVGGEAVHLLDNRFQLVQTLTAGFLFLGLTTAVLGRWRFHAPASKEMHRRPTTRNKKMEIGLDGFQRGSALDTNSK